MFGRIAPWKGQHVFVEALALLVQQYPTVHGLIAGAAEGDSGAAYALEVQAAIDALGLAGRLHMLGFRADVPDLLAAVDCVAHCSVAPEPFGRVIIEGMAAGRPVVAAAAGGALEIIADGVDGLLTPPGDVRALAQALGRLLADPAEAARLGQAGRATVAQRYQAAAHAQAVQAFYERVLAAPREV
jgi:glycosyltransferase involved in cell wall biosynthesis